MTLSAPHFVLRREGYKSWSLLMSATKKSRTVDKVFSSLVPGDLMLLAARPGQGKTLLSLEMAVAAMVAGRGCTFRFDHSDEICADYIVAQLGAASEGTFVIINYLQAKMVPDLGDVRLPNPLDLHLFDKTCFLHKGTVMFDVVGDSGG